MRPVGVLANGSGSEIEQLEADLRSRWRQATRAVMVLLSAHGLPPAQIAALLDCHPATVRHSINRFKDEGRAGEWRSPCSEPLVWACSSACADVRSSGICISMRMPACRPVSVAFVDSTLVTHIAPNTCWLVLLCGGRHGIQIGLFCHDAAPRRDNHPALRR